MLSLRAHDGVPFAIGHRGAMGHAPENTMASFRRAWLLGARMVELDVQLTADNQLVVLHDPTIDRTTNGHGAVDRLTAEEIRSFDAGSWCGAGFAGQRVPLLGEVIEWARGKVGLVIEAKTDPARASAFIDVLPRELRERDFIEQCLIISFDHPFLKELKDANKRIAVGPVYVARLYDPVRAVRAIHGSAVHMHQSCVVAEDVAALHEAGIAVSVWTVNEPAEIQQVAALGVDSITTNYPDRVEPNVRQVAGR